MTDPSFDTALARMQASRLRPSEAPYTAGNQLTLRQLYTQRSVLAAQDAAYTGEHLLDYTHLQKAIRERERDWKPEQAEAQPVVEAPRQCQMCGIPGRLVVPGTRSCVMCAAAVRNGV